MIMKQLIVVMIIIVVHEADFAQDPGPVKRGGGYCWLRCRRLELPDRELFV